MHRRMQSNAPLLLPAISPRHAGALPALPVEAGSRRREDLARPTSDRLHWIGLDTLRILPDNMERSTRPTQWARACGRAPAPCWSDGRAVWFLRGAKGRLDPPRIQDATGGLEPPSAEAVRRPRWWCGGTGAPGSDLQLLDPPLVGCREGPRAQPMGVAWVDVLARVAGDDVRDEAMAGARLPRQVCRQDAGRGGADESERNDDRLRPPRTHPGPTWSSLAASGRVAGRGNWSASSILQQLCGRVLGHSGRGCAGGGMREKPAREVGMAAGGH
jgi:hypothetical protein